MFVVSVLFSQIRPLAFSGIIYFEAIDLIHIYSYPSEFQRDHLEKGEKEKNNNRGENVCTKSHLQLLQKNKFSIRTNAFNFLLTKIEVCA